MPATEGIDLVDKTASSSESLSSEEFSDLTPVTFRELLFGSAADNIPSLIPHFFQVTLGQFMKTKNKTSGKTADEIYNEKIMIETQLGIVSSLLASLAGSIYFNSSIDMVAFQVIGFLSILVFVFAILSSIFQIILYTQLPMSAIPTFHQLLGSLTMTTTYIFMLSTWLFLADLVLYLYFTVPYSAFVGVVVGLYFFGCVAGGINLVVSAAYKKVTNRHEKEERIK